LIVLNDELVASFLEEVRGSLGVLTALRSVGRAL